MMEYVATLSVGNAAIAVVAAVLAVYELLIYRRDREATEHAWLAGLCALASMHAIAVFAHYNATPGLVPFINRCEGSALSLIAHALVGFAGAATRRPVPVRARYVLASAALWLVIVWSPLSVTAIELRPMWGLPTLFARRVDNPVVLIGYVYGYAMALASLVWLVCHRPRRRGRVALFVGLGLWAAAILIDILSGLVFEVMWPLALQYGFLVFVLSLVTEHAAGYIQMLRASERDFRRVIDRSPDAIVVVRDASVAHYANPAFEELFGPHPEGEMLDAVHPDDRAHVAAVLAGNNDTLRPEPVRWRDRNGDLVDVEMLVVSAEFERQPAAVAILRDASARKALNARMIEMDRMIAVGTLAAGVGHEINNPLAFTLLNIQDAIVGLGDESKPVDRKEALGWLRSAHDGAKRVTDIVRSLRALSLSEGSAAAVDLKELVGSAVTLTRNEVRHRATLILELADVPRIRANPARLGQVFVNLLLNAAQATPEGDPDAHTITVRLAERDGAIVFEVEDTGPGVAADRQEEIFEAFYTTKVGHGSGLGLSICRAAMQAIGGDVTLETSERGGALFRGTIPAQAIVTDATPEFEEEISRRRLRGRVLLVEDEVELLRALTRQLRRVAHVEGCSSAREALARIESEPPYDVVVSDLMMPEMTGMELYERVAAEHPDVAERFVFVTGGAFTAEANAFCKEVGRPVLYKPVEIDDLVVLIDKHVSARPKRASQRARSDDNGRG
jgi:PAS domain S-box-containing protein